MNLWHYINTLFVFWERGAVPLYITPNSYFQVTIWHPKGTGTMFLFVLYTLLLCIFLFSLLVIPSQLRRNLKYSGMGPSAYPIIGCLISFYKNRYRLLDWYTELLSVSKTQTIIIQRLGARRTIITANAENVEYMLKTNFSNYPKGQPFTELLGDFLGCGIFNVDGEKWLTQRKLASHEFTDRSLREHVMAILEQEVEGKLMTKMERLAENHQVVDLQELLRKLAFDIICKVSLGIDVGSLESDMTESSLAKAFNAASQICAKRGAEPVSFLWKMKRGLGIGSERKLKEAIEEIQAFVTKVIRDKKNGQIYGDDLLSRMILAGHEEIVLRDMAISFIMAGRDTTSAAMTWMFYLLTCHSDVEKELVKELIFVENERLSDYEALKKMTFLKACLCETMRLYPPVVWDSKHASLDDSLPDGTKVHAGDRVTYFPYGMGRMINLWGENRLEFKPERWFTGTEGQERGALKEECPYKFPVFQAGPRICLGKEMAFIQMKFVVASILRRFELRPVCWDKPVFVPQLTAHMAGGLKVNVLRRQKGTKMV